MSPGSVYLLASSQKATLDAAVAHARSAMGRAPRVAVSYAAAGGPHAGQMSGYLAKAFDGASVTRFTVPGEASAMPAETARAIVAEADLIFLGGGDPVHGARLLANAGTDAWLREAHARGAHTMGISAGAMMLCAWWAAWPDPLPVDAPHDGGALVPCTGVVPDLVLDCHAEEDDWAELHLVRAIFHDHVAAHPATRPVRFLGLPTGSALILTPGNAPQSVGPPPYRLD